MKRLFLYILLFLASVYTFGQCDALIKGIPERQLRFATADLRYTFTEFSEDAEEKSIPLTSEIWRKGDKTLLTNPYSTVVADDEVQITILKEAKLILIKHSIVNTQTQAPDFKGFDATCIKENGLVHIDYTLQKDQDEIKLVPYAWVRYTFNAENEMVSNAFKVHPNSQEEHVITYDNIRFDVSSAPYQGSAMDYIMSGNKLKPEYSTYTLRDLRKANQ